MSWINRLRGSLRKNRLENQLDDELQFHIEMRTQEFVGAGMSQEEARYRAARLFGNRVLLKEGTRDMDTIGWIETIWQDLRYGLRMAHKNRGFTAVAVLTLALGIAVNTTIFSLTSAMLLRRPSVGDPDRVAVVLSINATKAEDRELVSVPDFIAWREENRSFERIAAANGDTDFSLTGQGEPERVIGMRVSANYFRTLGVSPMFGRTLLTGEDQPGREHVAVVSQDLWQRRYASDPNILGKTIALNGEDYTVVGVMPAAFRLMMFPNHHVWTPLVFSSQQRSPAARESRSL